MLKTVITKSQISVIIFSGSSQTSLGREVSIPMARQCDMGESFFRVINMG